jgi:hypothetical protein
VKVVCISVSENASMDLASQRSSASKVYFSRAKRLILILALVVVLGLEIYTSYSVTPSSSSSTNTNTNTTNCGKCLCSEGARRFRNIQKLISVFKNFNTTTIRGSVPLTDNEWSELEEVLRK